MRKTSIPPPPHFQLKVKNPVLEFLTIYGVLGTE